MPAKSSIFDLETFEQSLTKVRQDLESGNALVTLLEPRSVEVVEECEEEGPSYVIESGNRELFLLTGQEMERYRHGEFPWSKFGVIESLRSKRFFGLERIGDPIPISRKRLPFSYRQAKALGCFDIADSTSIILDERKKELLRNP